MKAKWKYKPRPCVVCGKLFPPTNTTGKTCPGECRKEHRRRYNASPERLAKAREQEKTAARRAARLARNREWHRKKMATDPEYRERKKRQSRTNALKRYQTDPEYREKVKAAARDYYVEREADPAKKAKRQASGRKWERSQAAQAALAQLAAVAAELEALA